MATIDGHGGRGCHSQAEVGGHHVPCCILNGVDPCSIIESIKGSAVKESGYISRRKADNTVKRVGIGRARSAQCTVKLPAILGRAAGMGQSAPNAVELEEKLPSSLMTMPDDTLLLGGQMQRTGNMRCGWR